MADPRQEQLEQLAAQVLSEAKRAQRVARVNTQLAARLLEKIRLTDQEVTEENGTRNE